jgi:hypothetical protein
MAMRLLIEMASGLIILGPPAVAFLAAEQIIATFFEVGEYARWHPEITKQVVDAGMTVGHAHLVP